MKADVIGEIRGNARDRYNRLWEDIEDEHGRESFRELFAHIFVIKTGDRFHRKLAKAFKDNVLDKPNGAEFVDETLAPYSEAFRVVATFALTTQVVNETAWTTRVLERRQKQLIKALKAEWRLN